jgi:excisionase family DNA binding protein
MNNLPTLMTLQEVAQYCRVPLATVRYWTAMRRFPVIKMGRKPLVEENDLMFYLKSKKIGLPAQEPRCDP